MADLVTVHGFTFIRAGECRQCGACGCDKGPCPHLVQYEGKFWCTIYNSRQLYCAECGTDHASCIVFPDNPWIRVVREGKCGYTFRRADGGSMDDLPFLDGNPWQLQ